MTDIRTQCDLDGYFLGFLPTSKAVAALMHRVGSSDTHLLCL